MGNTVAWVVGEAPSQAQGDTDSTGPSRPPIAQHGAPDDKLLAVMTDFGMRAIGLHIARTHTLATLRALDQRGIDDLVASLPLTPSQQASVGLLLQMLVDRHQRRVPPNPLHFYEKAHPYYEFTNFSYFPFNAENTDWPTSEHYFQAQKFPRNGAHWNAISQLSTPRDAFEYAQKHTSDVDPNWYNIPPRKHSEVRIDAMRRAVLSKFTAHAVLRRRLLSTGDSLLVEHTNNDSFWGDAPNGKGENRLGIILMEMRAYLIENSEKLNTPDLPVD